MMSGSDACKTEEKTGGMKKMMDKNEEMVLVAPREWVFQLTEPFLGISTDPNVVSTILKQYAMFHSFKRRGDMETDESYKQLIPYVTIRRGDEYLSYVRLEGGGEERLHHTISLGFGGHMNDVQNEHGMSVRFKEKIMNNLWRELEEELHFSFSPDDCDLRFVGIINDDDDPLEVGKYHLGLAAILDIPVDAKIRVKEDEAHDIAFKTLEELETDKGAAEAWTRHLIDWLGQGGA